MSCSCVYVEADGANASFYRASTHCARKAHTCNECGGTIQPGELYEYVAASWGGDFEALKTCAICLAVRRVFFCGQFTHTTVWEDLRAHIEGIGDDFDVDCLAELPKDARDEVCDMIQEYWEATA